MCYKKFLAIIFLAVIFLSIFSSCSFACSTFMLKKDDSFIIGHNDDEYKDYMPGYFFINKRGVLKTSFSVNNLLGKLDVAPKIQWISQYGSITWNAFGREFPMGGVNEAGLHIDVMSLQETRYPETNLQPHMLVCQWVQYQLDNYRSVDEVIRNSMQLIPEFDTWHFFISDKQGDYACLEFIDGKPKIYNGNSMPVPALCNSQYSLELFYLKSYQGFGGARDIFETYNGIDTRFVQAATMIKDYRPDQSKPIVQYGFDILKQLERGNNKWSIIIDVNHSMIYFHTSLCRKVKYFSYKDFDFSAKTPVTMFNLNSNYEGDIIKKFIPYSLKTNQKLTTELFKEINKQTKSQFNEVFLSNGITMNDAIKRMSHYPEDTTPIKSRARNSPKIIRYAGTVFNTSNQHQTLVGYNEDGLDKDAKVWFLPAKKNKFGRMFFGYINADPVGGINDHGLSYHRVIFYQGKTLPPSAQKPTFAGNIFEYIIEKCSTVEQALKIIQKYNIYNLGYFRIMFVDKNGDSVTITGDESGNKLNIIRQNATHQVLGNEENILESTLAKDYSNIPISCFRAMLKATHQVETVQSGIYNLKNRIIYLYYLGNFNTPVKFNLDVELKKGEHIYDLCSLFPQHQYTIFHSITDKYYSPANKAIILFLLTVLLSPFVIWPLHYFIDKAKYHNQNVAEAAKQNRPRSLLAKSLAILNSILCLSVLYLAMKYSLFIIKYGLNICGGIVSLIPWVITLITIGEIIMVILLWRNKIWSIFGWLYYILLILTAIFGVILILNLKLVVGW